MVQKDCVNQKIVCIGGPTGVGKTALAIQLANLFDGEIVSCDSIAIYKHLNIGSAKPTKDEQQQAKHYMIDIKEPNEEFSVAEYRNMAKKIIDDILSRGKLPIVVGGTGLYMKGLLFPLDLGHTDKSPEIRAKYKEIAEQKGGAYLLEYLKDIDPKSTEKLHDKDINRIIRAIEIFELTGKKKSDYQTKLESEFDYKLIFLNDDRKKLYERIDKRVLKMIDLGLENEVKELVENYNLSRDNQSMSGIGYKEFFDYFEGKIDKKQLIEQIQKNSRHYAKRQITWFKAMPNVCEYNYKDKDAIILDIKKFLHNWFICKSQLIILKWRYMKKDLKNLVIAIDGPAGAGKTTVAKALAGRLEIPYFSTGAMYRALALKCLRSGKNPENKDDAEQIAKSAKLSLKYANGKQSVILDGEDVTDMLYSDQISVGASQISVHKYVREKMVDIQRQVANQQNVIMDGRDIGSVVLPMAKYKFYLDADVNVRAKRRYDELLSKGSQISFEEVLQDMKERDFRDKNRDISPLIVCDDAVVIDSTNLSVEQVVDEFISKIK